MRTGANIDIEIAGGQIAVNLVNVLGRLIPDSGKIHQNQEVYRAIGQDAIATIKATSYKDPPKVLIEVNNE